MWPMGLCIFAFLVFIGLQVLQFLRNSGAAIFEKRRYYTFVPSCNQLAPAAASYRLFLLREAAVPACCFVWLRMFAGASAADVR